MNRIKQLLIEKGFEIQVNGSSVIYAVSTNCDISILKNYKGYHAVLCRWASLSFGERTRLSTTKSKEICEWLQRKVN